MSLAEFWEGPPRLVKYYREAHRLKMEEENQKAWVQGMYFKSALDSSLSAIFKKKGSRGLKYVEEPFDIFGKNEREIKREAEEAKQKVVNYLNKLMREQKRRKAKSGDK